jgi:hypothetical protein
MTKRTNEWGGRAKRGRPGRRLRHPSYGVIPAASPDQRPKPKKDQSREGPKGLDACPKMTELEDESKNIRASATEKDPRTSQLNCLALISGWSRYSLSLVGPL